MRSQESDIGPSAGIRLLLTTIACGLCGIFVIAWRLEPDPRGYGTHQQLGLPPCQFRDLLGVACPHCGMTTSFSNFVRGRFRAAWAANPLGIPLAVAWAIYIPWCFTVAASGRWIGTRHPIGLLISGMIGYLTLAFLQWVAGCVW